MLPWIRRTTADGRDLHFYPDGSITGAMGYYLRGVRKIPISVSRWLSGDACLFDWDELPTVLKTARDLHKRNPDALPGDYRAAVCKKLRK